MSNRTWRIIGTGLSFFIFGIVGAILSIALIPIVLITPASELRQKTGKRLVKLCFQAFLKIMQLLGVMTLKTEHLERLKSGGRLVLANHPSLIDVVILIALVNNPDGVIKTPLLYNPFTLGLLRFAGFIRNEEGPELIVKSIRSVKTGNNLIVFPEGTRTRDVNALTFKRGASNIAVRGKLNITPILIFTSEPVLQKGVKWYKVPHQKPVFTISVCEEIEIAKVVNCDGDLSIESRALTRYLEDYFRDKLKSHART